MSDYSTNELKTAWSALYNTDSNSLWQAINYELAKRLNKEEYKKFITNKNH